MTLNVLIGKLEVIPPELMESYQCFGTIKLSPSSTLFKLLRRLVCFGGFIIIIKDGYRDRCLYRCVY